MRHGFASLLLLAAIAPLVAEARAEFTAEGPHVTVTSTVHDPRVAGWCRDLVEEAIPVYEKELPRRLAEGEKLVYHLLATREEFAAAMKERKAEEFTHHDAVTLEGDKESWVLVLPRSDTAYLDLAGGLPEVTRWNVVHEGVHQVLYRAGDVHYPTWPCWISEGQADWVAGTVLRARSGARPVVLADDERATLQTLLARGSMLSVERVLLANVLEFRERWEFGCHAALLYGLLRQDAERMKRLQDALCRLPEPTKGTNARRRYEASLAVSSLVAETCGPLAALDRRWREELRSERPRWIQGSWYAETTEEGVLCGSTAKFPAAYVIAAEPPTGETLEVSFESRLAEGRQTDFYLGWEAVPAERFLKIGFGNEGNVTLIGFSDGAWQEHLRVNEAVPKDTFVVGHWIPIRVTVAGGKIVVEAGGVKRLEAEVPRTYDALRGRWGLGTFDSVASFRGIRVNGKDVK